MRTSILFVVAIVGYAVLVPGRLAAQIPTAGHPGDYTSADIAYGARLYEAQCTGCHGPSGDGVTGIDFRTGRFRTAVSDDDLMRVIANGVSGKGMPAFKFDPAEQVAIVAYLRNVNAFDAGSLKAGDTARGRLVFEGKGACTRCHRIAGQGSRVAPDLSAIGAVRSAGSIQRSLMDPTSQMMPINRPVRAVTRDGRIVNGRRLNEDTFTVQLFDDQERLVSLKKADLREYTIGMVSPMPSYKDQLTDDERADVVAYLLSRKGR